MPLVPPDVDTLRRYLTYAEAAAAFDVPDNTLRQWASRYNWQRYRDGSKVRIDRNDVARQVAKLPDWRLSLPEVPRE